MLVYWRVSKFSPKSWNKTKTQRNPKSFIRHLHRNPKQFSHFLGESLHGFSFPQLSPLKRLNQSKSCKTSVPFVCFLLLETTKCQNNTLRTMNHKVLVWLVVEPTHSEKHESSHGNLPNRGEQKKSLKPTPRYPFGSRLWSIKSFRVDNKKRQEIRPRFVNLTKFVTPESYGSRNLEQDSTAFFWSSLRMCIPNETPKTTKIELS